MPVLVPEALLHQGSLLVFERSKKGPRGCGAGRMVQLLQHVEGSQAHGRITLRDHLVRQSYENQMRAWKYL